MHTLIVISSLALHYIGVRMVIVEVIKLRKEEQQQLNLTVEELL